MTRSLHPSASRRRLQRGREAAIGALLRLCALGAVGALVLIMAFVFREALPVVFDAATRREANASSLLHTPIWQPVRLVPKYGLLPLVTGTLKVVAIAMAFAVPAGVLAALFASEFAPARVREALKPVVEILAGIPSVVLGFFALIVMASWIQAVTGAPSLDLLRDRTAQPCESLCGARLDHQRWQDPEDAEHGLDHGRESHHPKALSRVELRNRADRVAVDLRDAAQIQDNAVRDRLGRVHGQLDQSCRLGRSQLRAARANDHHRPLPFDVEPQSRGWHGAGNAICSPRGAHGRRPSSIASKRLKMPDSGPLRPRGRVEKTGGPPRGG